MNEWGVVVLIAVVYMVLNDLHQRSKSKEESRKKAYDREQDARRDSANREDARRYDIKHKAEENRKRKDEENRQRKAEEDRQRNAAEAKQRKDKEAKQHRDEAVRKEQEAIDRANMEKAKVAAAEELAQLFTTLKSNLPFYTSNRTPSAELVDHDKKVWEDVTKLVEAQDSKQATLYFVRIKSLLDDNEYYKIGITTAGVNTRFQKSTQVELLETVCTFDTELWKAAYLEYHFLREFRLYDGLADSLGELRPNVGFSGYTEVVRSNSVNKIAEFFGQLDVYNTPN